VKKEMEIGFVKGKSEVVREDYRLYIPIIDDFINLGTLL